MSKKYQIFTGNQLKLLAMIAMTCDHIGLQLFPQFPVLRIIGRLALPIYAYMIAEGCRYTRDRKRHFLSIALMAVLCQVVFWFAQGSLYQCILVTFALSVGLIYALDHARKTHSTKANLLALVVASVVLFATVFLPEILPPDLYYDVDYGIWGVLLPVLVYFAPKGMTVPAMALGLLPLCLSYGGIQWWSYLALLFLACYNGTRGRAKLKNLFYIYYPAHLAVIYLISLLIY